MSRDKADTLLLLTACALVLLPQYGDAPMWTLASCAILLLWRGWITFRGNRMPPRWLLLPIAALAMAAVYVNFKTLFGHQAGVAMLMLLLALKLLEMHARRDLFVAVFLAYFLLLTNFFNSQSMGAALMTLATLTVLLTAQLSFQYTGAMPSFGKRLKLALFIVALALPLTVVQFILFPRIQGPLWSMPGDGVVGRTGLSDSMSPGNIAKLAQSEEVAFRVRFLDPAPTQDKLYWRGVVLNAFDGRTWTRASTQDRQPQQLQTRGQPIRHEITLEPHARRWLFALEQPAQAPTLSDNAATITADGQLLSSQPINDRLRYRVASYIDFSLLSQAPTADNARWRLLPSGFNPQTQAFAHRLRRQYPDDAQLAAAVLRFFHDKKFSYTLEPPLLGRDAVDDFLFTTRAGFCEHFAGAFTVLMRAAGIPARVVTGYQGGEINPVDGYMTIRQSDAHAWSEIWLADRGWVRIDPTAAVAPNRVHLNLSQTVASPALGGLVNLNAIVGRGSWLHTIRFRWDAVTNAWNQWVLNYTPDRQRGLIESFGFGDVNWRTLTILLMAVGMATLAVIAWPLLRHRRKPDPLRAVYARFCLLMAKRGLARAPHEGPRTYLQRIEQSGETLPAAKKLAAARFLTCYEAVQYGTFSAAPISTNLAQLKSLLIPCR